MSIMTEKSIECNSSVSDSAGSPIATFRDYAENIKRYIRTGSYASGLTCITHLYWQNCIVFCCVLV